VTRHSMCPVLDIPRQVLLIRDPVREQCVPR
jgi:hypothetical protein